MPGGGLAAVMKITREFLFTVGELRSHRYVAGLAIEVGAVFGKHDFKSDRDTLNGCRLGIFVLPQVRQARLAADRTP